MRTFWLFFGALWATISANAQPPRTELSDAHFWHTVSTSASPDSIWSIWTQVAGWHRWDIGLKSASLVGRFEQGARGEIYSLEGRRSRFVLERCEATNYSYTFKTRLPFGALRIRRSLQVQDGRTVFTHEVWFTGASRRLFARMFGGRFRAMLPQAMENIKQLAESPIPAAGHLENH